MTLYYRGALIWGVEPGAAVTSLKVQYRQDENPPLPYNNEIKPGLQIVNTGATSVPLSSLTIRYWYTAENPNNLAQSYWCDWAVLNCANVTGAFVKLPSPRTNADAYLQVGFASGAGSLAPGAATGEIQNRFNKSDWSNYNETNDYSYDSTKTTFADWNRVTLYQNGVLMWGTEP